MTKLMMLGGLLSAATTGYWGALSDSRGRILCLQLANFGQLGTALGSILLVTYPEHLGEKWAMLGVALSGLLGGDLASQIVTQAYLSDIVGGSRAQVFSINEAIQYVGVGLGPVLGESGALGRGSSSPLTFCQTRKVASPIDGLDCF